MQNHESASTLKGRDPEAGRYWTLDGMPSSLPRRAGDPGMQPKGMPATFGPCQCASRARAHQQVPNDGQAAFGAAVQKVAGDGQRGAALRQ